ncbi:MAG: cellulase family glycosylhydrolase [Candidatus Hodarchaeota archaeon]
MLAIENGWFIDDFGRKVLLRGINLGGSSKVPKTPNGATHLKSDFTNYNVSFVGRPFPLQEAPTHFQRIRHWGFNALRFLITWEAIEHSGPRCYDKEYLDYIEEILKVAAEHELYIFIDPHQDLWGRASGGDGAPIWTYEKVGLDVRQFDASEAAFVMQHRYDPTNADAYPPMSWLQNYGRFATCTMFTLFFGGIDFAPASKIEGISTQDYLQKHFINAIKQVAKRIHDNPFVIGFETMNEPSPGWIGQRVDGASKLISRELFYSINPFDAMLLAAGFPREIPYNLIKRFAIREIRRDLLNPGRISCWLDGFEDVWRQHGVWGLNEVGTPVILRNDYFQIQNGKQVDFLEDYLSPFVQRFASMIREICPQTLIGIQLPAEGAMHGEAFLSNPPENSVNSSHWYDEITVGLKRFRGWLSYDTVNNRLVLGNTNVQKMFIRQLGKIKAMSKDIPTIVGEFGLCFDLNNRKAFQILKDRPRNAWRTHIQALSMYYNAMDANLLHSMLWNYTADNDNTWGDQWNQEDFSIFSRTQQINPTDINSGGRAIEGFCRPYFIAVAGTPLLMTFSTKRKVFRFEFDANPGIDAPTILYIPQIQYPNGYRVAAPDLLLEETSNPQLLAFRVHDTGAKRILITPV